MGVERVQARYAGHHRGCPPAAAGTCSVLARSIGAPAVRCRFRRPPFDVNVGGPGNQGPEYRPSTGGHHDRADDPHPGRARRGAAPTTSGRNDPSAEPVLLLIGSPMGAAGFGTLAGHFTDRTVVTYDPRGVERSERTDGATESTPDEHADDLHRLIAALGAGPVDLFASSGGAVNALALVARHPEQVRTLVAHEPPAAQVLPDREAALAACRGHPRDLPAQRHRAGDGEVHRAGQPQGPDPGRLRRPAGARPGDVRAADRGRRLPRRRAARAEHRRRAPTTSPTSTPSARHRPASSSRPAPSPRARWPTARRWPSPSGSARRRSTFPSDHGGFLGGEYGQTGEPDAFAAKLREVLAANR